MVKYIAFLLAFTAFVANAGVLNEAKQIQKNSIQANGQDSATAARIVAGCGYDYPCDADGNRIYDAYKNAPNVVDFYKNNCKADGMFGMTKEQLIAKKGIPSKGYAINADTEIMSYSSLSANGESVNTTTYTLDRGIITNIK